ncbi:MAG: SRPBCC family protein [Gammaproteobacteria bacterium]|nr:SRPBCC family protein [Gammaproteobacteria bacterium]
MKVINIHSRMLQASSKEVGALVDTLSSKSDLLWPHKLWPKMEFDKPLSVSANGGHGPIRYFVEEYSAGEHIKFRFTGPSGFDGYHGYDVIEIEPDKTELRQTLKMRARGIALLTWPLLFRPLHDALIEDSLSFAELHLNLTPTVAKWSLYVRLLRWVISRGKGREQKIA